MRKLLRLWVMTKINISEEYLLKGLKSVNVDVTELNHKQISAYKSAFKQIEADLLIDHAFNNERTKLKDVK